MVHRQSSCRRYRVVMAHVAVLAVTWLCRRAIAGSFLTSTAMASLPSSRCLNNGFLSVIMKAGECRLDMTSRREPY
ncbi:hypothetical protein L249_4330 [Ophiocordyceps polyrhachis-furcata BCC 54312]|uniref:Uncharacterized protein n=1 Tax=Ophiocordyceps polyrhachis-furcata BCC 54312 TaxID=1330021 RepID=A0A367L8E7_9HYPO|nr:hypothetical protein L249_4330 [Ophiocordyceps polyrhachis-furcata BCC 54312]